MGEYLTTTTSTCPTCGRLIPAKVIVDGAVWFEKHCPEHGPSKCMVYPDADEYLGLSRYNRAASAVLEPRAAGACPGSCGLCASHEQHICMPIIEITDHCDLECPICLVKNRSSFHMSRADVSGILDRLIASEGRLDVVTLSGGEPTLNPEFRGIVAECLSRPEITCVSVSTNGVKLAGDGDLLSFLADRNVVISLQYDGADDRVYDKLRGAKLVRSKMRLIDDASRADARMSLTATAARGVNEEGLGEIVKLAFERDNIVSVMFQPIAYVGRAADKAPHGERLGIPDVIRLLEAGTGGRVKAADFSPLPCSHPACFSLAFYLGVVGGEYVGVKGIVDVDRYLDMIRNRALFGTDEESFAEARDAVYDLWSGPSALTPDGERAMQALKHLIEDVTCCGGFDPSRTLRVAERAMKSIFVHHFMDRHNFDLSRARKCCNVYPLRDGRMMPACVYNCLSR